MPRSFGASNWTFIVYSAREQHFRALIDDAQQKGCFRFNKKHDEAGLIFEVIHSN